MLERTCLLQFRVFLYLSFKEAPQGFLIARDLGANIVGGLEIDKITWRLNTPEKRSTENKTQWERLPKGDRLERLRLLTCRSQRSSIPSRNVLRQRNQGSFEHDLWRFLRWNFLRFVGPLNIFVPFLVPVDKNNSQDQI